MRDFMQTHMKRDTWGFCNCDAWVDIDCICNRIILGHTLLIWEWVCRANAVLDEDDDFIMLSEFGLDPRVMAYIRFFMLEEVSVKIVEDDDAILVKGSYPAKVLITFR